MNDFFFFKYQNVPLVMSVIETPAHRQVNPAATNFFATEKIEKIPEIRWKPPKNSFATCRLLTDSRSCLLLTL